MLEQAVRLPPGGAVTGRPAVGGVPHSSTASSLTGGPGSRFVWPSGRTALTRSGRTVRSSYERLDVGDVVFTSWPPVTSPERAAFEEARRTGDVRDAVVVLENLAAARVTSPRRVGEYAAQHPGARRVGVVRAAIPMSGEHSRSPTETSW